MEGHYMPQASMLCNHVESGRHIEAVPADLQLHLKLGMRATITT